MPAVVAEQQSERLLVTSAERTEQAVMAVQPEDGLHHEQRRGRRRARDRKLGKASAPTGDRRRVLLGESSGGRNPMIRLQRRRPGRFS